MGWLGQLKHRAVGAYVARFRTYGPMEFGAALEQLGVRPGDALMVHASMHALSGFTGSPSQLVSQLKEAVGEEGLVVMPSMTYSDSTQAFLLRAEPLRIATSPSRMGLLSEMFRRSRGVCRSINPAHPLLAWGRDALEFVAGHDRTSYSFGDASPFRKLLDRDAAILCLDVPLEAVTFTHFLEDRHRDRLPFALYEPEPLEGRVVDRSGHTHVVQTFVLSEESRRRRCEDVLWRSARRTGAVRTARVGNSRLQLMRCASLTRLFDQMFESGENWFRADADA